MPERGFDTGFWTDPFVRKLKPEGKLLFGYLWTNDHCNQAGCYQIDLETIAFETKLAESDLPDLLRKLYPKVQWYPDQDIIWVKNFLRRQAKSPKFLVAAKKAINHCHIPEDIKDDFELYNESLLQDITPSEHISPTKRECVIIRDRFICQYCGKEIVDASDYEMDHIIPIARGGKDNYLNLVTSCRSCNQKKIDKLPQEVGLKQPTPTTFHGAQATFILKNNKEIREKWLRLFPGRYRVVESILNNIEQHCFEIPSVSVSVSESISDSVDKFGIEGGPGGEKITGVKLFQELVDKYSYAFGKMPSSKFTAQLRDLGEEIDKAGGVTRKQIYDAFRETAGQEQSKWTPSYVRAILFDWLGIERKRGPP